MQREHKFLPLVISLAAGLVVSIRMILNRDNSISSVLIVLGVMLGFYVLGLIFRAVLGMLSTKEEPESEQQQDSEDSEDIETDGGQQSKSET